MLPPPTEGQNIMRMMIKVRHTYFFLQDMKTAAYTTEVRYSTDDVICDKPAANGQKYDFATHHSRRHKT